jgi:hypothetical protein
MESLVFTRFFARGQYGEASPAYPSGQVRYRIVPPSHRGGERHAPTGKTAADELLAKAMNRTAARFQPPATWPGEARGAERDSDLQSTLNWRSSCCHNLKLQGQ